MKEETGDNKETMASENETSAHATSLQVISAAIPKDPAKLARLVVKHAISFRTAALQCGYSEALAAKGQAFACANSEAIAAAFRHENAAILQDYPARLKPIALERLEKEIADYDHGDGIRAIEVLGRMKEFDWFVKSQDTQIGVLIDLDVTPEKTTENPVKQSEFEDK